MGTVESFPPNKRTKRKKHTKRLSGTVLFFTGVRREHHSDVKPSEEPRPKKRSRLKRDTIELPDQE